MSDASNREANGIPRRRGLSKITGAVIAMLGLFWLAHKAGWIPMDHTHAAVFWPVVVIAAGLFIVFKSGHGTRHNS